LILIGELHAKQPLSTCMFDCVQKVEVRIV
jgi:hypothetical protein